MSAVVDTILRTMTYAVGTGIFVNVLDDAYIDARYFLGRLGDERLRIVPRDDLENVEQKRIAIMLPAWNEADVIEEMLEHNLFAVDYARDRYDIFCGTYQNDPETQACVDAAARRFRNVHKVIVPHDGPTSKADCLNWIHQGILLEEQRTKRRFDILLMHDAEDIIHPLSLRLYSLLIPTYEFVQTPVFSLPLPKTDFVSGTYIDEFAEHHLKDMLVREAIGGLVPSAGVGSAFAREAFEEIAVANGQQPFNVDSLTEDYEIGLKFRLANRRTHFACRTVICGEGKDAREEFIATREYFPSELRASVRQRSRWILGITMQTWQQIGWRGALPVLYCLWRDRKAVFMNALLLCAYALLLFTAGYGSYAAAAGMTWSFANVLSPDSPFTWVLGTNFAFAWWRLAMKVNFVNRLYGPGHALLSAPRLFLANAIGIAATCRAASQYLSHRLSGEPLRWLKTAHEFPTTERLGTARRRLGEYLLDQRAVSETELDVALALQQTTGARLGDVLVRTGAVEPSAVVEALGQQLDMRAIASIDVDAIPLAVLRHVPEAIAEEMNVLPIAESTDHVVVAMVELAGEDVLARLRDLAGKAVEPRLTPVDALRSARERAYRRLVREGLSLERTEEESGEIIDEAAVDQRAVADLGLAFCFFHNVLPIKRLGEHPARLLCAAPLHWSVRELISRRLGHVCNIELALDPAALRIALAAVEGALPALTEHAGFFGIDAVEWRAIEEHLGARIDCIALAREALARGLSPLEWLDESRLADASTIANVRAHVYGLGITEVCGASAVGLLPPHLVVANDVTVLEQDEDSVALAAPAPSPRLAQEVASLLTPIKVAWSIRKARKAS
jgi:bacteriophage N4 adsorption protein B